MRYGICTLNSVAVRFEPSESSEMVTQLLFGDHFKLIEIRKKWVKIRIAFDGYEGWLDTLHFHEISEEQFKEIENQSPEFAADLIDYIQDSFGQLTPITLGASVQNLHWFKSNYEGRRITGIQPKKNLLSTAMLYLTAPYLWGGKTPFGIDCSGFTQMVYKLNGYLLKRDASQQAKQGEALSFVEESEPGDLAFFDNHEGNIIHVGIIMPDNYIIHAHGKVRIDRIDHTGIFNTNTNRYSHKLRVIKKII